MYYDTLRQVILPDEQIAEMGIPDDREFLANLGIYPCIIEEPEYNPAIEGIEPDGEPEMIEQEDGSVVFEQKMKVVNLLENFRGVKVQDLAAARWERQCMGFYIAEGVRILTAPDDFSRLLSMRETATGEKISVKTADGWRDFSRERFGEIIQLCGKYVEACYAHERRLGNAISIANSIERLNFIDLSQGWPDNHEPVLEAADPNLPDENNGNPPVEVE